MKPKRFDDPEEIQRLADVARKRHNTTSHWLMLNLYICVLNFLIQPLPDVVGVATVALDVLARHLISASSMSRASFGR